MGNKLTISNFHPYETGIIKPYFGALSQGIDSRALTEFWHQKLRENGFSPDNKICFEVEEEYHDSYVVMLWDWKVYIGKGTIIER